MADHGGKEGFNSEASSSFVINIIKRHSDSDEEGTEQDRTLSLIQVEPFPDLPLYADPGKYYDSGQWFGMAFVSPVDGQEKYKWDVYKLPLAIKLLRYRLEVVHKSPTMRISSSSSPQPLGLR